MKIQTDTANVCTINNVTAKSLRLFQLAAAQIKAAKGARGTNINKLNKLLKKSIAYIYINALT